MRSSITEVTQWQLSALKNYSELDAKMCQRFYDELVALPPSVFREPVDSWGVHGTPDRQKEGQYLVPVRRGGPWGKGGGFWEVWRSGIQKNSVSFPYRVHAGHLEYEGLYSWQRSSDDHDLHEIELRAPKDYDGPCPEGCRWLEEEPSGWTPKPGDRVRGTRDDWKGLVGTIRYAEGNHYAKVRWDEGQLCPFGNQAGFTIFTCNYQPTVYLELIEAVAQEWVPKVGDRVAHIGSGMLGWTTESTNETWKSKVIVDWDKQLPDGTVYGWRDIDELRCVSRVRPDGTLDLPVRKVGREEWARLTNNDRYNASLEEQRTSLTIRGAHTTYWKHPVPLRFVGDDLQYEGYESSHWCNLRRYQPGDEDHMEWIVCDDA